MSQHRYFKGPELDALLEEVRRELGTEATIVEANKVRSGGVAGFFATENFEVVATEPEIDDELAVDDDPFELQAFDRDPVDRVVFPAARPDDLVDISAANSPNNATPPTNGSMSPTNGSAPPTNRGSVPIDASPSPANGSAPVATALLERADAISVLERVDISVADNGRTPAPLFEEVLATELAAVEAEYVEAEYDFENAITTEPALAEPAVAEPTIAPAEIADAVVPEPAIAEALLAEPAPLWPAATAPPSLETIVDSVHALEPEPVQLFKPAAETEIQPTAAPAAALTDTAEVAAFTVASDATAATSFWDRYDAFQAATSSSSDRPTIVTVIGQLDNAANVAEVLSREWGMPIEPVVATTSHAGAVPEWNVERSLHGLEARVQYWKETGRHGIVTVDAALQNDARTYIDTARDAGSEVLHLAVNSDISPEDLVRFLEAQTGDVVVHFADRPHPDYLIGLFERGIVVGSVDGLSIDPSMMLALAMAAGRG